MTHIELPRALEDYFAFAETDSTRTGRRFSITLPYFDGARIDRLQWWYHQTKEQEERLGDASIRTLREQATARFRKHIERWLENTGKRLYAHEHEPIPHIGPLTAESADVAAPVVATALTAPASEGVATNVLAWPSEKVANG